MKTILTIGAYCFLAGALGFWLGIKLAVREMNKHIGQFTHLFTIEEPVDIVKDIVKEKN